MGEILKMNFYQKIKNDFNNKRNHHGLRNRCLVDTKALYELLDDYERMDSLLRAQADDPYLSLSHRLHNFLQAMYHKNPDSERLMLEIMSTLKPLIEERLKRKEIYQIYKRP